MQTMLILETLILSKKLFLLKNSFLRGTYLWFGNDFGIVAILCFISIDIFNINNAIVLCKNNIRMLFSYNMNATYYSYLVIVDILLMLMV